MLFWLSVTLLLTLWLYKVYKTNLKYGDFVGPSTFLSLPMVGHAWLLGNDPITKVKELSDQYGDMFKFDIGGMPTIVLCSHDVIKEVFFKDSFCGRSWNEIPTLAEGFCGTGDDGRPVMNLTLVDPPMWTEMRKFVLKNLTNLGVGNRDTMEEVIAQEADQLIATFEEKKGGPIKSSSLFLCPVNNVIWRIVTGKRSKHDDPELLRLTNLVERCFKDLDPSDFWSLMPMSSLVVAKVYQLLGWSNFIDNCGEVRRFVRKELDAGSPDENGDYIERALHERQMLTDKGVSSFLIGSDGLKRIESELADMFLAGTDTTATFLEWLFLYCIKYPHHQERAYKEIFELTSENCRQVSIDDRENAHFTSAFIEEIIRDSPMLIFPPGRKAMEDTMLRGKLVPKGTQLVSLNVVINHDPKVYPEPNVFKPERFLDENGKFNKDNQPILFGFGKRRCPGEVLARAEMFLFAARIIQTFRLRAANLESLTMEAQSRLVMFPKTFEFVAEPRTQ